MVTQFCSLRSGGVIAGQAVAVLGGPCYHVPRPALPFIRSVSESRCVLLIAWETALKGLPLVSW